MSEEKFGLSFDLHDEVQKIKSSFNVVDVPVCKTKGCLFVGTSARVYFLHPGKVFCCSSCNQIIQDQT